MSEPNYPLHPRVTSVITALFSAAERETITELLLEECNTERIYLSSAQGLERIQLAILKLSNGEVDKFLAAAELAQIDWRDVLMAAGFGEDVEAHLKWAEKIRE
jgi:hypothetical protein